MLQADVIDLGLVEYDVAWKLQEEYANQIAQGERPATLLLLEHPHVYTFGRKGHQENLLWGQQLLKERGVEVLWVDRGGDVTYHGPGQLVGYPLLSLGPVRNPAPASSDAGSSSTMRIPDADYIGYVRKLRRFSFALWQSSALPPASSMP